MGTFWHRDCLPLLAAARDTARPRSGPGALRDGNLARIQAPTAAPKTSSFCRLFCKQAFLQMQKHLLRAI